MTTSSRLPSVRPTTRRQRIERDNSLKNRDDLFLDEKSPEKFEFNSKVAEVFDDMLKRSVPLYRECQDLTVEWCKRLAKPDSCIYDLGCSTGSLLSPLARSIPDLPGLRLIGIDNSPAMLGKAHEKLGSFANSVSLVEADLNDSFSFNPACAIVMNYTLQFIAPEGRKSLLEQIYQSLIPDGGLILNEKVLSEDERLRETFVEMHHDFKQGHGYSQMEISKKRDALENILIPWKLSKTKALIHEAGFTTVDVFFKWNNFAGLVALK
ncbi:MAG TPA: carboxy-S-adenosyl-L-methionine synthase CmoA [Nitrospina sp.]|nr:carboxy-S-adenosyl-L-methionine synthase CmoA [Nitrospinota bacterium]HAX45332.1 carboxy-S-adenosyl-L-methionine synthase CmoA [Nitrospina sp.]